MGVWWQRRARRATPLGRSGKLPLGRSGKLPLGRSGKLPLARSGDKRRAEGAVGRGVEDRGVGAEVADRGQVARVGF